VSDRLRECSRREQGVPRTTRSLSVRRAISVEMSLSQLSLSSLVLNSSVTL